MWPTSLPLTVDMATDAMIVTEGMWEGLSAMVVVMVSRSNENKKPHSRMALDIYAGVSCMRYLVMTVLAQTHARSAFGCHIKLE